MRLFGQAVVAVRHAIKREILSRLPGNVQEAIDRRFYYRRFASGALSWEPEFELLPDLVRPDELVVDVGANLGGYGIKLSELVGPGGEVHCFEPIPRTFRLLQYNLEHLAPYRNHHSHLAAVGAHDGVTQMHVPLEGRLPNYYVATMTNRSRAAAMIIDVRVVALDSVIPRARRAITLLKIDVEGAESDVLVGAQGLLHEHRPVVICEVSRGAAASRAETVFDLMRRFGYRAFRYRAPRLYPLTTFDESDDPNYVFAAGPLASRIEHLVQ